MIAVLYRWRVAPGREREFEAAWAEATTAIHTHCGSYGSRLHRAENGDYLAYARWPDEAALEACPARLPDDLTCFAAMRDCALERFEETHLTIADDLLDEPAAGAAKPDQPTFETDRLTLRPLRVEDGDDLNAAFGDPECLTYWSRPSDQSVEETREQVARTVANEKVTCWAITEREGADAGRALGWVVLVDVRPGVADIGFLLRRDRWGRGYASEAAKAAMDYGFGEMGLHRIQADIDPDNAASIAVIEKLGLRREGHLIGAWKTHIGLRDSLIYGLVRPEAAD